MFFVQYFVHVFIGKVRTSVCTLCNSNTIFFVQLATIYTLAVQNYIISGINMTSEFTVMYG